MQAAIFRWRRQIFPGPRVLFRLQFSPERIDQLKPDGDVPHQFTALVISHGESVLRQMVFPKFSGIVEENAGYEQIAIKLRINRAKPESHSYHLGSVLDQAATTSVMIIARRGRAAKAIAKIFQEYLADPP